MKLFSKFVSKNDININQELKCTIRLLDDNEIQTYEFSNTTIGQNILDHVTQKLDLLEKDYFGLRYMENNKQRNWVDPIKLLVKQFKNVSPYVLCFRVRFYPPNPEALQEEITKYFLFSQLRRDLLHGRLFINQIDGPILAAYILQSEIGDYDSTEMEAGYISQYKLLMKQTPKVEEKIAEIHKSLRGQVPSEAEMNFLKKASRLETYGIDPYPVKDQKNSHMYIGINYSGIMTFQGNNKMHHFKWDQIKRIDFDGKILVIHLFVDEKKHVIGFKCPTQASCKHIWKTAIEQRDFFHLKNSNETKIHRSGGGLFSRSSKYRYSGRVERELSKEISEKNLLTPGDRKIPTVMRKCSLKDFQRTKGGTYFSNKAKPLIYHKPKVYASDSANYTSISRVGAPDDFKQIHDTENGGTVNNIPLSSVFTKTSTPNAHAPFPYQDSFQSGSTIDISPTKSESLRSPPNRPPPPNFIKVPPTPLPKNLIAGTDLQNSPAPPVFNNNNNNSRNTFSPNTAATLLLSSLKGGMGKHIFRKAFSLNTTSTSSTLNKSVDYSAPIHGDSGDDSNLYGGDMVDSPSLGNNRQHESAPYQTYMEEEMPDFSPVKLREAAHSSIKKRAGSPPPRPPPHGESFKNKLYKNSSIPSAIPVTSVINRDEKTADFYKQVLLAASSARKSTSFVPPADHDGEENEPGDVEFTEDELLAQANQEILKLQRDKRNHLPGPDARLNLSNFIPPNSTEGAKTRENLHLNSTTPKYPAKSYTFSPVIKSASELLGRLSPSLVEKTNPFFTKIDAILTTNGGGIVNRSKHSASTTQPRIPRGISSIPSKSKAKNSGGGTFYQIVGREPTLLSKLMLLLLLFTLLGLALVLLMESNNPNTLRLFKSYPQLRKFQRDTYVPLKKDVVKYWEKIFAL